LPVRFRIRGSDRVQISVTVRVWFGLGFSVRFRVGVWGLFGVQFVLGRGFVRAIYLILLKLGLVLGFWLGFSFSLVDGLGLVLGFMTQFWFGSGIGFILGFGIHLGIVLGLGFMSGLWLGLGFKLGAGL